MRKRERFEYKLVEWSFFYYHYSHILDTPVTEREFLEQLHELNHKINFVKEQSFRDARACHDVKDILEKLKIKVPCLHWIFEIEIYLWFQNKS